jgi:TnpA family transposase
VLLDPAIEDEQVGGRLRNTIGLERLRAAAAGSTPRLPRDHGHLAMLDDSYTYLRQFTPNVLQAIAFKGGAGAESLLEAVKILKELNATGARKVPDGAPADFVPVRWAGYLEQAAKSKDATAYRHFWELTVLLGLRDGLRSGDVYVPSSRRYADPASYLFTPEQWAGQRDQFCQLAGKPSEARAALDGCKEKLQTAMGRMADACGISYDILAWTQEWYIREETLAAANAAIVNYHHRLPMTQVFGGGTLSSSDGQRFPVQGKSTTARAMKKYFAGQGLSTYTHVSNQHSTFGTKVIVVTRREAQYVLDEIMGNKTDLPITEHATDTHGVTLVNFALFDLVGMQLSPRIRDLGKITLYRMDPQRDVSRLWPVAGPLLTQKINMGLIEETWDDLLRLAASIKFGHVTASLIVGKLSASSRQNTLAAALKEYGALRRTVYAARYLADETYRRKIARQLNKGESLHSLRRDLHYAQNPESSRFLKSCCAAFFGEFSELAGVWSVPGSVRGWPCVQEPGAPFDLPCAGVEDESLRAVQEAAGAVDSVGVSCGDVEVIEADALARPGQAVSADCGQVGEAAKEHHGLAGREGLGDRAEADDRAAGGSRDRCVVGLPVAHDQRCGRVRAGVDAVDPAHAAGLERADPCLPAGEREAGDQRRAPAGPEGSFGHAGAVEAVGGAIPFTGAGQLGIGLAVIGRAEAEAVEGTGSHLSACADGAVVDGRIHCAGSGAVADGGRVADPEQVGELQRVSAAGFCFSVEHQAQHPARQPGHLPQRPRHHGRRPGAGRRGLAHREELVAADDADGVAIAVVDPLCSPCAGGRWQQPPAPALSHYRLAAITRQS